MSHASAPRHRLAGAFSVALGAAIFLALPGLDRDPAGAPAASAAARSAEGPALCAVPPVPGKSGFRATSRFGPARDGRPFRAPGEPAAARALPDTLDVLAIRVDFEDEAMDSTQAYIERAFLFMAQYWNQVTYGRVVTRTTVTDSVYRLPETMAYYGYDPEFETRQVLFIRDAIQVADDDVDMSAFDVHIAVHAGAGQEADVLGDSPEQLWSVFAPFEVLAAYLPDSTAANGILTDDRKADGDPYYVQFALVLPEVESQDQTPSGVPFVFGMTGVYAHEFGHALGLPDLYDTTPSDVPDSQGLGAFDIMAAGTWNANGFVPARPSAWCLFDLGYLDALMVTTPGRVDLWSVASEPPADQPRLAAVPLGGDEYFLIENRVQDPNANGMFDWNDADQDSIFDYYDDDYTGAEFDFFLPGDGAGSGLLIYHVDPSTIAANFIANTVVANPRHKGVDLEEADGIEDLDDYARSLDSFGSPNDAFRAGNATRFAPDTTPSTVSSFGVPSFVTIDDVSAAGDVMSFTVSFDRRKGGNWPAAIAGPVGGNHPVSFDLDTEIPGLETVVVDTTGGVWVIAADGAIRGNAPLAAIGSDANTTPAIGDVDGDGVAELVVVAADGSIYAWNGDGSEVVDGDRDPATTGVFAQAGRSLRDAVPVLARLGGPVAAVIVGAPADSNGMGEVLWAEIQRDSPGLPVRLGRAEIAGDLTAPPLVFDTMPPTLLVAAVADTRTRFFAVEPDPLGGAATITEISRDRADMQHAVRSMIGGDLDGDGTFEVLASDDHGRIEAYATGLPVAGGGELTALRGLAGWPFALGLGVAHDLALADMDRDGRREVLVSAFDGRLLALNFNGTPQLSYPLAMGGPDRLIPRLAPSPLAIDLAGDERPELLFAPGDGRAFATDVDGQVLAGWPLPGPAAKGALPIVADLDGDERLDLVVPSDMGSGTQLIAYDLGVAAGPGSAWTEYRGGPAHGGIVTTPPAEPAPAEFADQIFVYPNPVRGDQATIHFSLGEEATVDVEILDALGRVVARPAAGEALPGRTDHEVVWDVRDAASGVYLVRLEIKGQGAQVIETRPFAVTR
jgi:immune inhibitor A